MAADMTCHAIGSLSRSDFGFYVRSVRQNSKGRGKWWFIYSVALDFRPEMYFHTQNLPNKQRQTKRDVLP
jgi:hypothetical protein